MRSSIETGSSRVFEPFKSPRFKLRSEEPSLALGAQPMRILAGVLIDGVTITAIGVVAGGLVGWGLSRLVGNYVPELKLPEPLLLIASAAVIFAAAAIASLLPAVRAARVDAVQALRAE